MVYYMRQLLSLPAHAAMLCVALQTGVAAAASLSVQAGDSGGQPVGDVVVYAEPAAAQHVPPSRQTVEIEQKARKFAPLVSVVQTGTAISFPNNDSVRHHVYSFSPAKSFELKLYSGVPSAPLVFDKAGSVVLGCNIHDQMVAYIHIVDTPYFAKTDASGKARLELPAGKYTLKAWHYNQSATGAGAISEQALTIKAGENTAGFKLSLKPVVSRSDAQN